MADHDLNQIQSNSSSASVVICDVRCKFQNDGFDTKTSKEQKKVENMVEECYNIYLMNSSDNFKYPTLLRESHLPYLYQSFRVLSASYESLDASGPWIVFWTLHSLEILNERVSDELSTKIINYLDACQHLSGGYGGGPGQYAHVATTYAAVMALCILNTEKAYDSINRTGLCNFLLRCQQNDGSFVMHEGGETDIRGAYCAAAVASVTQITDQRLFEGTGEWLARCQTYEGGFAAYPGCEAHGGYTFCGLAALILLKKEPLCDLERLLKWIAFKQLSFEGGFQGRTNKLVDACYSYWQGATFPLVQKILNDQKGHVCENSSLFSTQALTNYLLICCQRPNGGLIDKPGRLRDLYHTCYALSGLCIAQIGLQNDELNIETDLDNLANIDPLLNISVENVRKAKDYYSSKPRF